MTLVTYHGRQADKDAILFQLVAHSAADALARGYGYCSDGKGCAVGCTVHPGNHVLMLIPALSTLWFATLPSCTSTRF